MADKFPNFAELEKHEKAGKDYRFLVRRADQAFALVAPHGGGIEAGTGNELSFT